MLGRVVTNVSGTPYRTYVAANILRPLGMSATTLDPSSVPKDRLALGYRWEDGGWKDEPLLADGSFGAMGGMLTTVPDLARYVGALLDAWPPRDGDERGPVRRASLREMQLIARARPSSIARAPGTGAPQLNAGGYGYGLRIFQTCTFDHVVAHGGGLPGFGTLMQWLPEYGVGIITFGNVTYAGWGGVVGRAFDALAKTGGLQRRMERPSAALAGARAAVTTLFQEWDDRLADRIAADNLFLDRSRERRRAEFDALKAKVGACRPAAEFDFVENALRGQWTMACERGSVRASITLAPTLPPRVQFLEIRPADGPFVRPRACPD
jgi:CubicO group peptidase (beta-lactamase class C family)